MDERMMFAVLGIEKTKDEEVIRSAYRELLQHAHPEDDPEGFKRLREAYENALKYAGRPGEGVEEPADASPVGQWMERVREVYFSWSRRLKQEEWERLAKEDVCVSLDDGEEAKWRLFSFLTQHYQLPSRVYRLFDRVFHVKEEADSFKERLPVNFVDFVLRKIDDVDGSMDYDYESLQGADDADYDGFINEYCKLNAQTAKKEAEAAWQTIQAMERLGISYPLFELQKAYAYMLLGKKEEALALIRPLSAEYPGKALIQVLGGEILYECGCHEEAQKQLLPYADKQYYHAEKYLSFYEEEQGNLTEAMYYCQNALRDQRGQELKEYAEKLEERFSAEVSSNGGGLSERAVICYLNLLDRRSCPKEALEFLERHPDYTKELKNLRGYYAYLYCQMERYEEAIKECRLCREELAGHGEEDGGKDAKKEQEKRQWVIMSYWSEGRAFFQMGKAGNKEAYAGALEAYAAASRLAPDSMEIRQKILDILIEQKKYEEALKLADELINANPGWFPAYVQKQEACFALKRDQEVVDCFYAARKIYAQAAAIYERAADVFVHHGQYRDAEHIFGLAKEAGIDNIKLDIAKLRSFSLKEKGYLQELRKQKRQQDFRLDKELTGLIKEVKAKYKEKPADDEDMCSLFFELGRTEHERRHLKEAARNFRKALKYEDRSYCHYWLANVLLEAGETKKAQLEYHKYEERETPPDTYYTTVARRYRSEGKREAAIEYFKKALELNPENKEANGAIANLYRMIMWDTGNRYYGNIGMEHMERQLELTPDSALEIRRKALLLSNMGRLEESLDYFDKTLELDKSHYSYAGKGKALRHLGRYEEALECLRMAIDAGGSAGPEAIVYGDGGCCMCKMGRFAEAEDWFRRGIERYKNNPDAWLYSMLIWLHDKRGEFEKAKAVCREKLEAGLMDEGNMNRNALNMTSCLA